MITAKKTFSSKSQVININSINLFLLIPYHFQISLSSPTATSRLHKLVNFLGSARRINRLLLVTTNRQKTGPQKKMAATMKRAGKATIDCHFRLRLAGSFFPAQPWLWAASGVGRPRPRLYKGWAAWNTISLQLDADRVRRLVTHGRQHVSL